MAFQKGRENQENYAGLEVVADNFSTSTGVVVGSAARQTAVIAVAAVASANAGATYTSAEQTLINEIKAQLNALIAALKT